jgi:S1-C subfamily serine protease
MTTADWQQGMVSAVQAAKIATVRVARDRCRSTSGTVISADLLVTSQHALGQGDEATITDDLGTEYEAHLVGTDAGTDLALLRVEGAGLTPSQFASHETLQVGQLALALGRPGASIRASLRMIGLLSDELQTPMGGRIERYIETDRGFPEGFRGGPLVDTQGCVIGMNTDALLRGADLAVPYATISRVVAELVAHGRVRRGYLGVAAQPLRLPTALRQTLKQRSGALVLDTDADGPARSAGLRFGDVIIAIDEAPVRGPRELVAVLAHKLGAAVEVRFVRGGVLESLQVTLTERS